MHDILTTDITQYAYVSWYATRALTDTDPSTLNYIMDSILGHLYSGPDQPEN